MLNSVYNRTYNPEISARGNINNNWREFKQFSSKPKNILLNGKTQNAYNCSCCGVTYLKKTLALYCCFETKRTEYNLK